MTTRPEDGVPRELARALDAISDLAPEAIETLQAAIRIPSVSPSLDPDSPGETPCNELLASTARRLGLEADLWEQAPGRANLAVWAPGGAATGDGLLVGGHIDVVPGGDPSTWTDGDPFSGCYAGGRIWGRGACDMKAGVVAAIFAVAAVERAGLQLASPLIAHSVVGEESNEHELGVQALLDRGHRAGAAVIGEPTSAAAPFVPAIATVGWLFCDIAVTGRATHVALRGEIVRRAAERDVPAEERLGVNSVELAVTVIEHLRRLEREWMDSKRHRLWQRGDFCIHPGSLQAGPSGTDNPAIYGDAALLRCSVLYPPDQSSADIRAEVEGHLARLADVDPWFAQHPVGVSWSLDWPPAEQLPSSRIVTACTAAAADLRALGRHVSDQPAAMLGVCDASWLASEGVAAIACGPGSIHHAHAADESVGVDEFVDAIGLYVAQAIRYCGVR